MDAHEAFARFNGMDIIIDDVAMSETKEDWSDVRAPSRAIRRRKRGFRQNIKYRLVPKQEAILFGDRLIMHSEIRRRLREQMRPTP